MAKNSQVILDQIVAQENQNFPEYTDKDKFFEFYSIMQKLKSYELTYEEIEAGITGESHDGGADAIYLFVNGDLVREDEDVKERYKRNVDIELIILQAKNTASFGEDPLMKFGRLSRNLLDMEFERSDFEGRYTERVLNAFELFRDTYFGLVTKKPQLKIRYIYITKGSDVHPNVKSQAADLEKEVKAMIVNSDVVVEFVGADALFRYSQERINDVYRLRVVENPMTCSHQKVFIALVNLGEYFSFITDNEGKILKHIFESNVRDYQGRTNVNSEIAFTLENEKKHEFWWLNNGVTIIASDASAPGGKELVIYNPEIVNGLQTSNEVYKYYSENTEALSTEARNILVRIIVPESEESRDKIIKATNSQTPIPKASLRATDTIHRQIEEYLKPKGLFYDRRKNFYKNEGKKPKDIVTVSFMAQCLMSVLLQKPDFARARPSTLLEKDEEYTKLYHHENDISVYYKLAYIGKKIESVLKETQKYTTSEVTNILFYVIYAVVAVSSGSVYPSSKNLSGVKVEAISEEEILKTAESVYDLYRALGGTDQIAKGTKFSEALREKLREKLV